MKIVTDLGGDRKLLFFVHDKTKSLSFVPPGACEPRVLDEPPTALDLFCKDNASATETHNSAGAWSALTAKQRAVYSARAKQAEADFYALAVRTFRKE